MVELSVTQFDYSGIEEKDIKGKLINLEGRIKKKHAGMADSIIEIGQELATAQAILADHHNGTFQKWVEQACGFSIRTAYRYINVFTRFGDSRASVAQLEDTALYALAESETPKKAVDEALRLAAKGNRITHSLAKELIAKHSPNGKHKSSPPKAVASVPVAYKPRHSESVKDDTETCPNCGCNWWRPVQGGHNCDKCNQPLGEPVGNPDEESEREHGDMEQAELSKPAEGSLKKARAALGVIIRWCDEMKLTAEAKPHVEALAKIIGK